MTIVYIDDYENYVKIVTEAAYILSEELDCLVDPIYVPPRHGNEALYLDDDGRQLTLDEESALELRGRLLQVPDVQKYVTAQDTLFLVDIDFGKHLEIYGLRVARYIARQGVSQEQIRLLTSFASLAWTTTGAAPWFSVIHKQDLAKVNASRVLVEQLYAIALHMSGEREGWSVDDFRRRLDRPSWEDLKQRLIQRTNQVNQPYRGFRELLLRSVGDPQAKRLCQQIVAHVLFEMSSRSRPLVEDVLFHKIATEVNRRVRRTDADAKPRGPIPQTEGEKSSGGSLGSEEVESVLIALNRSPVRRKPWEMYKAKSSYTDLKEDEARQFCQLIRMCAEG